MTVQIHQYVKVLEYSLLGYSFTTYRGRLLRKWMQVGSSQKDGETQFAVSRPLIRINFKSSFDIMKDNELF